MAAFAHEIKLFNKWSTEEVKVTDVSLLDYIPVRGKHAVFVPHTAGRYQKKAFRKSQCPIVERLANSLMMHGRNTGKKLYVLLYLLVHIDS
jgi:small subunit ribosomal protein S5e